MDQRGYAGGPPRPPLLPLDQEARAEITRIVSTATSSE
jgi:dihydrodipicolinate synthase/N-acetylneuraminate lyase